VSDEAVIVSIAVLFFVSLSAACVWFYWRFLNGYE